MVYNEKMDETCKDVYKLKFLDNVNFLKVYNYPPYSLMIHADKVKEIKLPKPSRKIFWNDLI